MNGHDLKFLAARADSVGRPPDQRLAEVHARIRSARRRRAAEAVAGAVAAVLLVVGITALSSQSGTTKDHESLPANPNTPTTSVEPTIRKLVYVDGFWPMREIHVGDQTVDISDQLPANHGEDAHGEWGMVFLQVSGEGVVLLTNDGRIWFTDGNEVVPIGQLGHPTRITTQGALKTGTSASIAAWVDESHSAREIVVYDTTRRAEVARIACPRCGEPEIAGSHVYWSENGDVSRELTMVFDPEIGETRPVSAVAYAEDLASRPRALIVGDTRVGGNVETGLMQEFLGVDNHLVALADPDEPGAPKFTKAWDTGSGRQLALRLPEGYDGVMLRAFDWLDDDRVALEANFDIPGAANGILVCRISTGNCQVAVPGTRPRFVANIGFD